MAESGDQAFNQATSAALHQQDGSDFGQAASEKIAHLFEYNVLRDNRRERRLAEGFGGDAAAERVHHHEELRRAAENLARAIPGVEVAAYFVDFEGVWEADLAAV